MKRAFNIYPALFVLTPVRQEETVETGNMLKGVEGTSETEHYFTSYPQTYWGNCLYNADQTQLMFGLNTDLKACPVQTQLDGRLNILEPAKFKGEHYTITYIPVLN